MTIGATRRIDQLGRVVVPVELRRTLAIREGDLLEVTAEDGRLILRKVAPECALWRPPRQLDGFAREVRVPGVRPGDQARTGV